MPVIGLSCYLEPARWGAWELPAALIPEWYLDLFQAAGATVVLLPPGQGPEALDRLDGLAMAGGADIDAARYDAQPHETADMPRTTRDASELALYRRARELDLPVLGICRGLQVMAVAHGGTLIQNLPDVEGTIVHRERPGAFVDHEARFADGSIAASISADAARRAADRVALLEKLMLAAGGIAGPGTIGDAYAEPQPTEVTA